MIYRTLLLLTILGLSVANPVYSKAADSEDWLIRHERLRYRLMRMGRQTRWAAQ